MATKSHIEPAADPSDFDPTFGNFHNDNLFEGFDFDAFLQGDPGEPFDNQPASKAIKLDLDLSYTISKDLAGGKVAQKDRDLRLLLKGFAPSTVTGEQESSRHEDIALSVREHLEFETISRVPKVEADSAYSSLPVSMETPRVEARKAFTTPEPGCSRNNDSSQSFEQVSANSDCFLSLLLIG